MILDMVHSALTLLKEIKTKAGTHIIGARASKAAMVDPQLGTKSAEEPTGPLLIRAYRSVT